MEEIIEIPKCSQSNCQPEFKQVPSCCEDGQIDIVINCHSCKRQSKISTHDKKFLVNEWKYETQELNKQAGI